MSTAVAPPPDAARILLVDDQTENLTLLCDLLEPEGYRLMVARDGEEALTRAFATPPDLVLMDIQMPRLDGLEACRRLKADPRTHLVPVVLVTGLTAREDRIAGIAAGCDDFLTKPVDLEQLLARTRTALRTKALISKNPAEQQKFLKEADELKKQAEEIRNKQRSAAGGAAAKK